MALTIPYAPPQLIDIGPWAGADGVYDRILANSGQTILEGDFTILSAGKLSRAASSPSANTLAGLATHPVANLYTPPSSGAGTGTNFGVNGQLGTALMPNTEAGVSIVQFTLGMRLEMSLNTATTLAATLIGTAVYLVLDGTTNYYYASTTSGGTSIGTIVGIPGGPDAPFSGSSTRLGLSKGMIGDSGGRIIVEMNNTASFAL